MPLTPADVLAKKQEILAPGAYFELRDVELDGHSYKAYKNAPATLIDVLQAARNHGDVEFVVYEGKRYTYTQFYQAVDALAASLHHDLSVQPGDRVAIAMRNNPEWIISYAALTMIGAVVVPINSWGKSEELLYALSDSGAKLFICDPARLSLIENQLSELGVKALLAESAEGASMAESVERFEDVVARGEGRDYPVYDAKPSDNCVILYTSGSTGFPKGVLHRHIALCQSLMNMVYLGYLLMELEGVREYRGGAERETPLLTVPLFHATGLLSGFILPLQMGHKTVMMYKWDTLRALQLIQDEKITGVSSVPTVIQDLLRHPEFDNHDTSSLIRVGAAGAATPAGLPELIEEKCGNPSRSAGWGMTETLAVGATMSGCVFDLSPDSAGLPSPIVEMRFLDLNGEPATAVVGGELEVYSVCCTPGYWNKAEANADTFDSERWMKTGDIARVDEDGFLHITGRLKEIVIRGGENIYPGEIEQAVYEISQVKENVVFGVPDDAMGEELAMVVYVNEGETLSEEEVRSYLKSRIASYKIPKSIQFSAQPLQQNASGKLHKLKVKEAFLENL